MAEAGKKGAGLGLPGGDAAQWPLQRYGRFVLLGAGEPPGPGLDPGMASSPTWKVFDSNEESGYLILTIVISGHFFISQGQTLLEGFSLIGSKNWLKIVRRMDCLLFGTTIKDKSRMFRVQFGGESKQQALEFCDSCVQSLAQYVTVQMPEGSSQGPRLCRGPLPAADSRAEGCVRSGPLLLPGHKCRPWTKLHPILLPPVTVRTDAEGPLILKHNTVSGDSTRVTVLCVNQPFFTEYRYFEEHSVSHQEPGQQWYLPAVTGIAGGRSSVTQLAQSLLASEELPLVYEQSAWNSEELGPFLHLCLMDQCFPAFVEQVEKELKKLTGFRN